MITEDIYNAFLTLSGGRLVGMKWDGPDLGLRVEHPELAPVRNPEHLYFYLTLKHCHKFYLQPTSGTTVVLDSPEEILLLDLKLKDPKKTFAGQVKVPCYFGDEDSTGGTLSMLASGIRVYDQEFDVLDNGDLADIRRARVTAGTDRGIGLM